MSLDIIEVVCHEDGEPTALVRLEQCEGYAREFALEVLARLGFDQPTRERHVYDLANEMYLRQHPRTRADPEAAREKYHELLYAVEQREPGKSRHEAALELIRRGQRSDNEAAKENPTVRAAREGK